MWAARHGAKSACCLLVLPAVQPPNATLEGPPAAAGRMPARALEGRAAQACRLRAAPEPASATMAADGSCRAAHGSSWWGNRSQRRRVANWQPTTYVAALTNLRCADCLRKGIPRCAGRRQRTAQARVAPSRAGLAQENARLDAGCRGAQQQSNAAEQQCARKRSVDSAADLAPPRAPPPGGLDRDLEHAHCSMRAGGQPAHHILRSKQAAAARRADASTHLDPHSPCSGSWSLLVLLLVAVHSIVRADADTLHQQLY